jgi:hypothetical protein
MVVFILQVGPQSLLANTDVLPFASIELEREVYFLTPDDEDVVVPPGFYTVEPAPKGLQLIGGITPHEAGEAFLIQAKTRPHEEEVDQPRAMSISIDEDTYYLALLVPDGQIIETIGSYSGVRSRGETIWERVARETKERLENKGLTLEEWELIARRDALLNARARLLEERERERQKKKSGWRGACSKLHPKNANNHNSCCVKKYDSCLRVAKKKFTGSARRGFQQSCEEQNQTCWIMRKHHRPHWMAQYCDSKKNLRKIHVKSKEKCCSKMNKRCFKASLSVPTQSGRKESRDRCHRAYEICEGT